MKNTIVIDATKNCICDLVSTIDNGENRFFIEIRVDTSLNPRLEIESEQIQITGSPFICEIGPAYYVGTGILTFRIIDDTHTGEYFQVSKVQNLDGELCISQKSNFIYDLSVAKKLSGKYTTVSVKVGDTQTLPAGHDASVINVGDEQNVTLNFAIPKGKDGATPQMMINADGNLIAIYD